MNDLISRKALIAEYDRVHIGPPGGARKLMEDAPTVDAVEVPCKIGDTVWCIQNNFGRPIAKQGVVSQMYFVEDMRLSIYVRGLCGGEWGKRVFATREEAEAAVVERRTDG